LVTLEIPDFVDGMNCPLPMIHHKKNHNALLTNVIKLTGIQSY